MSAISNLLNQIKTAIYGEEVRDSIHDAIEQCYADVSAGVTIANTAANNANTKATAANNAASAANTAANTANTAANTIDSKINDIALVQANQPSSATNKIWVQPQSDEYQVPTWEEFSDVKSAINTKDDYFINTNSMPLRNEMIRGGIGETTGALNTNTKYLRNSDFLSFNSDITIVKDSSSLIWLHEYASADPSTWIGKTYYNGSSTGGHKTINTNHKYLICYSKNPSADIPVSDIPELSLTFFVVQDSNKLVSETDAEAFATDEDTAFLQRQITTGNVPTLNFSFESGTINESTGAEQASSYYVRSDDYITFNGDLTISKKADWLLWIYSWNLDGTGFARAIYMNASTLTGTVSVNPAKKYRLVFGKTGIAMQSAYYYENCEIVEDGNKLVHKSDLSDNAPKEAIKPNYVYYNGNLIRRAYNPYKDSGNLLLIGQLHCHTVGTGSGETQYCTPDELCQTYANNGYDFMTITDYGYIEAYGGKAAHPTTVPDNFIWLLDSQEISVPSGNGYVIKHMCIFNLTEGLTYTEYKSIQEIVDKLQPDGAICSLAHPMWTNTYYTPTQIKKSVQTGLRFCEIYDGLVETNQEVTVPSGMDTDFAWQTMLDEGMFVFGTAISDSHAVSDAAVKKGCIKVFCNQRNRYEIIKNICLGNFIACSNVTASITSLSVDDGLFSINTGDAGAITVFMKEEGTVLKTVTGANAEYQITGNEKYVRAKVTLSSGEKVWTQPVFNIIDDSYNRQAGGVYPTPYDYRLRY